MQYCFSIMTSRWQIYQVSYKLYHATHCSVLLQGLMIMNHILTTYKALLLLYYDANVPETLLKAPNIYASLQTSNRRQTIWVFKNGLQYQLSKTSLGWLRSQMHWNRPKITSGALFWWKLLCYFVTYHCSSSHQAITRISGTQLGATGFSTLSDQEHPAECFQ